MSPLCARQAQRDELELERDDQASTEQQACDAAALEASSRRGARACSSAREPGAAALDASSDASSDAEQAQPPRAATHPFGIEARRDLSSRLRLDQIRLQLLRQEDSIIFGWVKRAAYKRNDAAYSAEGLAACLPDEASRRGACSLLDWHLEETELLHARIRRYTSPDEHAFFPASLPPPLLPPLTYAYSNPLPRYADEINCNGRVMEAYLRAVLPAITEDGDDNNYGSTVLNDVAALQALSKRIHFGKFVAESKWRAQPELFHDAVQAGDGAAVLAALTYPEQEAAVAARVARKAAGFMASIEEAAAWGEVAPPHQPPCLVTPATVSRLWTELVMPLTKEVQVAYLLRRLEATQAPGAAAGTFVEGQARGRGPIGGFM